DQLERSTSANRALHVDPVPAKVEHVQRQVRFHRTEELLNIAQPHLTTLGSRGEHRHAALPKRSTTCSNTAPAFASNSSGVYARGRPSSRVTSIVSFTRALDCWVFCQSTVNTD